MRDYLNCRHLNWCFDFGDNDFAFYCPDCDTHLTTELLPEEEECNISDLPPQDDWEAWELLFDDIK